MKNLKTMTIAALFAALTTIATMIIQFPTPLGGYIHLGDGLVLLCGIVLGPITGGFAAGIGSMMADILSGYMHFAIPTLIIKALAAGLSGYCYHKVLKHQRDVHHTIVKVIISGIISGAIVVLGYYFYEWFMYGFAGAVGGVLMNVAQGVFAIVVACILSPILNKVPDLRFHHY